MPKFTYVDTKGASQTVDAASADIAMKTAQNIAPHSGVQLAEATNTNPTPNAAPVAPVPAVPSATPAPASKPTTVTTAAKGTLEDVAKTNGTNTQALAAANPKIENPTNVPMGTEVTVPAEKKVPVTTNPLSKVAASVYDAVKKVPNQNDAGAVQAAGAAAVSNAASVADPLSTAIAPIVTQMGAAINAILAPGPTYTSLADEYTQLSQSSGLQALDTKMLNMQNIMAGSEDDIRAEITASGGFATDSQVSAMTTARNNTLIKQYNVLAAQHQVAQDYVTNTMQYATQDQAEKDNQQGIALSKITAATGVLDKMASLQTTMLSTATSQYQKVVDEVGFDGLAQITDGSPYQRALAEASLGLPAGTLSDPNTVSNLQTKNQKTQLLSAAKTYFAATGTWPTWFDPATQSLKTDDGSTSPMSGGTSTGDTSDPVVAASQAILGNESGGNYDATSPVLQSGSHVGEKSYGKYQVLQSNIPSWTQQYYGQTLTPDQFLQNPDAQEAVQKGKMGELWNKYGNIQDVASVYFTGVPYAQAVKEGRKDQATGMTVQQYVAKAQNAFNGLTGGDSSAAPSTSGGTNNSLVPTTVSNTGMQQLIKEAAARGVDVHTNEAGPHTFTINGNVYTSTGGGFSVASTAPAGPATGGGTTGADGQYTPKTLSAPQVAKVLAKPSLTYEDIRDAYQNTPPTQIDPNNKTQVLNVSRLSMAVNRALSNYVKNPVIDTLAGGQQYLAKIEAGMTDPNSITDVDLLDSYVKLSTGGGQVTDAQVNTILKGASIKDKLNVWKKQTQAGGVLSQDQRSQLQSLAEEVYKNYQKLYKPVYTQAVNNMHKQGIPPSMWGNLPDLSQLSAVPTEIQSAASAASAPATY